MALCFMLLGFLGITDWINNMHIDFLTLIGILMIFLAS